jgi:hypothetical protein
MIDILVISSSSLLLINFGVAVGWMLVTFHEELISRLTSSLHCPFASRNIFNISIFFFPLQKTKLHMLENIAALRFIHAGGCPFLISAFSLSVL